MTFSQADELKVATESIQTMSAYYQEFKVERTAFGSRQGPMASVGVWKGRASLEDKNKHAASARSAEPKIRRSAHPLPENFFFELLWAAFRSSHEDNI